MSITAGDIIKKYIETRDEIATIQKEADEKIVPLKKYQASREEFLSKCLEDSGAKNIATNEGTAFFKTQEFISCADFNAYVEQNVIGPLSEVIKEKIGLNQEDAEEIYEIIRTNFPTECFTNAVNKTTVLEMMGEDRDKPVPHGVNYTAKRVVQVHRKK